MTQLRRKCLSEQMISEAYRTAEGEAVDSEATTLEEDEIDTVPDEALEHMWAKCLKALRQLGYVKPVIHGMEERK